MNKILLHLLCCWCSLVSLGSVNAEVTLSPQNVNCDTVNFTGGGGQITLNNLTALSEKISYFGVATNWQTIIACDGDCATTQTIPNLPAGTYIVKLLMLGEGGALCFREEEVVVTENTGGICDGSGGDADGDGICADADCDDTDASVGASQVPGTSCNDGNPNTNNDVIRADGCTCLGTIASGGTANCDIVTFSGGAGQFTLSNLLAQSERIEYFGAETNWQTINACEGNCADVQSVTGLSVGNYTVKLLMIGDDGTFCYREEIVAVTADNGNPCDGNGGDADGDGICADMDCDDTNAFIGASQTPGTSCNDGNPNTNNDVIQQDGCTCLGEVDTGVCAGRGGDADGDGICADEDCDDTQANIGMAQAPGTSCDDGNPNTDNDIILQDGCTCLGVIDGNLCAERGGDADSDGICADIDCDDTRADIGGAQVPGTSCDDGNPNTLNDIIQSDGCTCLGEIDPTFCEQRGGDADGDGVCADIDCDDTSADIGVAQVPGTSCDDGNPNTDNDVIQADGCMCLGDIVDCDAVTFEGGAGTITVSNLRAPIVELNIIGAPTNFELINICDGACNLQEVISNLAAGTYSVKLLLDGAGGCYREADVVVTASFAASSSNRNSTAVYVNGFANPQNIELQWVHNDERPKNYFVLEKSTDGQLFEPVQVVKSQDIGANVESYNELDEQPQTGDNYYRIGTAFSEGDFTYSEIVQVAFTPLDQFGIYPNPVNANGELFINLSDYAGETADLIIYNGFGQPVQTMQVDRVADSPIRVQVGGLTDGVYSIGIKVLGKRLQAKRFIVQKL